MHEQYAQMIMKGFSDFIEVKSYMHVGPSQQRLSRENMPLHEEIVSFCQELVKHLPEYEICSEHIPSRVVMLAKKKFKHDGVWHTWIDFEQWHELVNSGNEFGVDDYLKKTPLTGLSGKGTIDNMPERARKKYEDAKKEKEVFVDEKTDEMEFYEKDTTTTRL